MSNLTGYPTNRDLAGSSDHNFRFGNLSGTSRAQAMIRGIESSIVASLTLGSVGGASG